MKNRKKPSGAQKDTGRRGHDSSYEGDKGLGEEASAVRKPIRYGLFGAGMPAAKLKPPKRLRRR